MRALLLTLLALFTFGCSDVEPKPGGTDVGHDMGETTPDAGDAGNETDAAACPVVVDETCSGTETPKFIPTEDGCGEVRCVALDTFPCGDVMCDRAGEYCDVFVPGVPPPDGGDNTSYDCREYPAECLGANATCECVVGDTPADCSITEDGAMTVSVLAP